VAIGSETAETVVKNRDALWRLTRHSTGGRSSC
jgi:hypothetical protein